MKRNFREHKFSEEAKIIYSDMNPGDPCINLVPFGLVHYVLVKEMKLNEEDVFNALKEKKKELRSKNRGYYELIPFKKNNLSIEVNGKKLELDIKAREWKNEILKNTENVYFIKQAILSYKNAGKQNKTWKTSDPNSHQKTKKRKKSNEPNWLLFKPSRDEKGKNNLISITPEEANRFLENNLLI